MSCSAESVSPGKSVVVSVSNSIFCVSYGNGCGDIATAFICVVLRDASHALLSFVDKFLQLFDRCSILLHSSPYLRCCGGKIL